MVQAIASTALSAFTGQSRREVTRQPMPTALAVIGAAPDNKTAKRISKEADKERIYAFLTQPEVLGYIMAIGGLALVNNIPFSNDQVKNAYIQSLASTMSVLLGLGYAGVGDLTTMLVSLMAGGGSFISGVIDDVAEAGSETLRDAINPFNWKWPLGPIWNR